MERPKGSVASSDHHVIDDQVMDKGVMIKKVEHREGVHNYKLHASNNKNSNIAIGKNNMCLDLDDHYFATNGVQHNNDAYVASILSCYRETLVKEAKNSIGYPSNMDMNYEELETLHRFPINNAGDPFVSSNYRVHSKEFEVCVLNWFARLWEIEKNEYWGYVTNGGTECNLHGVLVGRQVLPDGILYASKDSHCSVFKAANICRIHCVKVATLVSGEIDCADFKLNLLNNNHKPAIVNVNIGTTMKGAVDDLDLVIQTLEQCGFKQDQFYIHCDGALFGFMLPFLKHGPKISFKKPIGSVSVSGHKFMGCPMPCGVQITRLKYTKAHYSKNIVEYINSRDVTISGSRNGHAPIYLWYALCKKGFYGFQNDVLECLKKARYLKDRLRCSGISAMLNNLSNTIVFERPPDEEFVRKWQLACEGNIAHVVVMPYIDIQKLDNFLNELIEKRTIWYQTQNCNPFCVATDIGVQNCACGNHHFTFPGTSSLVATSKL